MAFSKETFQLLDKLHQDPQYSVYKQEEKKFKRWLEKPFAKLLHDVALQLPDEISDFMILDAHVLGRIMNRAGVCDYFWGAFYPSWSASKVEDAQLLTFINHKYIEFGFFFGWYCPLERREEYLSNLRRLCRSGADYKMMVEFLAEQLPESTLRFREEDYEINGENVEDNGFTWRGYFDSVKDETAQNVSAYSPMVVYSRETVLDMTSQELADEISATFIGVFPLVILAISSDPIPAMRSYIEARK